ncbi:Catalase [Leptomonas seymouri]|uniref:Catalase n=1 Tax=Leptomonas seymouri TaxID=5684 RepID=A0A0N1IM35_LEPSE|nr:Catalase [Leptomonas seymouri]|eukprot:KPI89353.1 Catalase [Leptomonas seymouri]
MLSNESPSVAACPMRLTTEFGAPLVNNDNTMTAGPRGPTLLQDVWLLEKLAHFDREEIPERRMHAKGTGAFGTFTVTNDITKYTKAKLFSEVGKQTELFVRFSTVAGERGAPDLDRDIRGFAVKFYTEEGNWDLVGNNTPVFYFRDPLHFPDLNHAVKRDPRTNMRSAQHKWDFFTLLPESLHQVTIDMSDRGLPASYRHMHGFSSHAYSFINAANELVWVKFHLKSQQGIKNVTDAEAALIVGSDTESGQRDLVDAIDRGDYPRWDMKVQLMTQDQARQCPFNPFDLTKTWSQKEYPLIDVGVMELNRIPENYFADVEQAAFSPALVVPGISFSPDRMLQARLFSYGDAQRYRLGVNYSSIPVNAPRCPVHCYHRNGLMRVDGNNGSKLQYAPNSSGEWLNSAKSPVPEQPVEGFAAHYDFRKDDDDYYSCPRALFELMRPEQKTVLFENTARAMQGTKKEVQLRHIRNCMKAHRDYGLGVAKALGISEAEIWP